MPSARLSRPAAFWSLAALLVLVLASSGVPTPLYRVYQARFDFGPGLLTAVFGVYSFALLATLLVVGALSDHVGRRPVLAAGLALQAVAMVLFLAADGVGWLLSARVVQGLSTGALTGALGAALLDFQRQDRPLGPVVNSAGPGVGLAAGAVGAGLALQFLPAPTAWVYGTLTGAFALAAAGVLLLPESSPRLPGALTSLRPQVHVPRAQRPRFLVAVPCLVATWALGGLYLSLAPSVLAGVFGVDDHLAGSLLVLAMNGCAAVGSVAAHRLSGELAMSAGALVFAGGVAVTLVAVGTTSVPLLFASAVVSGLGFGSAFYGALATATRGVVPGARAGLMSSIFVVGYLSFSLPAIGAGLAAARVGLTLTAQVYGVAVVVLALVAVGGLLARRRADARLAARAVERRGSLAA
ncbi:MFS transporter [Geodermatophilus sp. YIM 151500]|uniref:MFS transporter n=1 Tax=Geodermatophilus sp. YIM 151500 TaxID=2984531 RepID=UPI0021E37D1D|nr:MFS transporter [Geodermatophilus sp. YIM 151500]MCV2491776.1 MFS transporter [Geodermatophilus sp. YIM 151500]